MLLCMACILTVAGASTLMVARLNVKTVSTGNDMLEARLLAQSAVERGLAVMDANINWRTTYTHDVETTPIALGSGKISFKLVDQADTDLANDPNDSVRVVGIARIGSVMQSYSVLANRLVGLTSLQTTICAAGDITTNSHVTANGGPIVTNGTLTNGNSITGDVEAASVLNSGGINGTVTVPAPLRDFPAASAVDYYINLASTISYSAIPGGFITNKLISKNTCAYATPDADAVYSITVPSNGSLTISGCRIIATLVVTLGNGASFTLTGANLWEPGPKNYPLLIINAVGAATISLSGNGAQLKELSALVNFNPGGNPYNGSTNSNMTDSYPNEMHGIIHIIGASTSTALSKLTLIGTLIANGTVDIGSNTTLTSNAQIYGNPPPGYSLPGQTRPAPGSWQREVAP